MTTVRIEMDGLNQLLSQLQKLGAVGQEVIEETIFDIATETQMEAVKGITGGPKSGRIYDSIFRMINGRAVPVGPRQGNNLSATHQASAPGQYPAADTGQLDGSVVALPQGDIGYIVGTNVMHGKYLEFGTSRMAARPWLLPSFEKAKIGIEREMRVKLEALL